MGAYVMDDVKLAQLGDKEAAKRLTDAGVLVPCPFCGGEAMVEYDTIEPFEYVVFCGDCGVMTTTSEDEQVARLAWNTRAPILSSEQMEKVWRGGWEPGNPICPICGKDKFDGLDADIWADWMPNFCPHCGAPMTDKAVDMVMERMEAIR